MSKLTTVAGALVADNQNTQTADHRDHHIDEDYYSLPGNLLHLLSTDKQQLLFDDTARSFSSAAPKIQQSHISNCS